jgi:hypothetical protein
MSDTFSITSRTRSLRWNLLLALVIGLQPLPLHAEFTIEPKQVFGGGIQRIELHECLPVQQELALAFYQLQGSLAAPLFEATSVGGKLRLDLPTVRAPVTLAARSSAFSQSLELEVYPQKLLGALRNWALEYGAVIVEANSTLPELEQALTEEEIPFSRQLAKEQAGKGVLLITRHRSSIALAKNQGVQQLMVLLLEDSPREVALVDRRTEIALARVPQRLLSGLQQQPAARILLRDLFEVLVSNPEVHYEN